MTTNNKPLENHRIAPHTDHPLAPPLTDKPLEDHLITPRMNHPLAPPPAPLTGKALSIIRLPLRPGNGSPAGTPTHGSRSWGGKN